MSTSFNTFYRNFSTDSLNKDIQSRNLNLKELCKERRWKEAFLILDIGDPLGSRSYATLIQACADLKLIAEGKRVHAHVIKTEIKLDIFLWNSLINMYAKIGNLADASQLFDELPKRNVFTWTAMISGYAQLGKGQEALELFLQMHVESIEPDKVALVCALNASAIIGALEHGKWLHAFVLKLRCEAGNIACNALVDMYAKCGNIQAACQVFETMSRRDVISWNTMISGYVQAGNGIEALHLFRSMHEEQMKPDKVTFVSILSACASMGDLDAGKSVHNLVVQAGFDSDLFVANTLVDMYAKCGNTEYARSIFNSIRGPDIVSWNSMIAGYAQQGDGDNALDLFKKMQQVGMEPNAVTLVSVISACISIGDLERGVKFHIYARRLGLDGNIFVSNTLICLYAKCGNMDNARQVFDEMIERDIVSWNAIIDGYVEHGQANEAISLFEEMQKISMEPGNATFVNILSACGIIAALEKGKQVHDQVRRSKDESNIIVGSALVDMYAKCGSIQTAREVFDSFVTHDVVLWSTLIAGYAQHGDGREAVMLFKKMQQEGVKADSITLISILFACNHSGLMDECHHYFIIIQEDHGITLNGDHYACLVDHLGRSGHVDQADDLINGMPIQPSSVVLIAFLSACRLHGDVMLAESIIDHVLELDPESDSAFVLLSNIYAAAGRWEDRARVRKMMEEIIIKRKPDRACININNLMHSFDDVDATCLIE